MPVLLTIGEIFFSCLTVMMRYIDLTLNYSVNWRNYCFVFGIMGFIVKRKSSALFIILQAMSLMAAMKRQKSVDEFRNLCSVEREVRCDVGFVVTRGLSIQVHSSHISRVKSGFRSRGFNNLYC